MKLTQKQEQKKKQIAHNLKNGTTMFLPIGTPQKELDVLASWGITVIQKDDKAEIISVVSPEIIDMFY